MSLNGGYAMIKYNSTQEELQIAYKSKKPVLFYDENQRSHWAVIEETAIQSVDEETQEPITLYEYSYKLLNDIEALVDKNGNKRFICGNGTPQNVSGMSVISSKWSLNGSNLIFEIIGFTTKNIPYNTKICTFNLPAWIAIKIIQLSSNIVDVPKYNLVTGDGGSVTTTLLISKNNNDVDFTTMNGITFPEAEGQVFFKFTYSTIIDND